MPEHAEIPYKRVQIVTERNALGAEMRLAVTQNDFVKIFVAYPLETVNDVLNSLFFSYRVYAPIAFLIAVVGGWLLAHTSLRPVDNITKAVREITAENLNQRLPMAPADDELGRLTNQFNDMISRLQNSFDRIQQFSVDVSHELRTPLTIMRGEVEVAMRGSGVNNDMRDLFRSLHEEIIRLASIVENLTSLAGSDMGRYSFARARVDMYSLLRQIESDAHVLAKNKQINVTLRAPDHVFVSGDAQRLRQLFLNLVDNAVKYTPSGGTIDLSIHRENGHAVVDIADTGIGIADEERDRIFDRFYRGTRSSSTESSGTGLGLSIAKWIAEAHNGSIQSKGNSPSGTVMSVTLPAES
jgi:heavy metal sensor kinase